MPVEYVYTYTETTVALGLCSTTKDEEIALLFKCVRE